MVAKTSAMFSFLTCCLLVGMTLGNVLNLYNNLLIKCPKGLPYFSAFPGVVPGPPAAEPPEMLVTQADSWAPDQLLKQNLLAGICLVVSLQSHKP